MCPRPKVGKGKGGKTCGMRRILLPMVSIGKVEGGQPAVESRSAMMERKTFGDSRPEGGLIASEVAATATLTSHGARVVKQHLMRGRIHWEPVES